jgi:hypothetical protein
MIISGATGFSLAFCKSQTCCVMDITARQQSFVLGGSTFS